MPIVLKVPRAFIMAVAVAAAGCAATGTVVPAAFPGARGSQPAIQPGGAAPSGPRLARVEGSPVVTAILDSARSLVGTPYRFGGASPAEGFDCSGLVRYVAKLHGIELPRTVAEQFGAGQVIDHSALTPGDLVFYSTVGPGATHVGIVVAAGNEWKFVHAPADGSTVRIERLDTSYWQQRWIGARRVF